MKPQQRGRRSQQQQEWPSSCLQSLYCSITVIMIYIYGILQQTYWQQQKIKSYLFCLEEKLVCNHFSGYFVLYLLCCEFYILPDCLRMTPNLVKKEVLALQPTSGGTHHEYHFFSCITEDGMEWVGKVHSCRYTMQHLLCNHHSHYMQNAINTLQQCS